MFSSKMSEQFILVQESQFAIFTARVTFVTSVVGISDTSMLSKVDTRIAAPFGRENLEIFSTNLTVEQLMDLSDMLLQFVELKEGRVITMRATILQQMIK